MSGHHRLPPRNLDNNEQAPPLPPKLCVQIPHSPSTTPLPASPDLGEDRPLIEQCQKLLEEENKRAEERSLLAHEDEFSDDDDHEPIPPPRCDELEAQMEEDLEGNIDENDIYKSDNSIVIIDNRMPSPILKMQQTPPTSNPGTSPSTPNQEMLPRDFAAASPKCVRFNMEPDINHFEIDSPHSDNGILQHHHQGGNSYEELIGLKVEQKEQCCNEPVQISISEIGRGEDAAEVMEGDLLYLADAECQTECAAQEVVEQTCLLADEDVPDEYTDKETDQQPG